MCICLCCQELALAVLGWAGLFWVEVLTGHLCDDCVAVDAGDAVAEGANLHASFIVKGTTVANCTSITADFRLSVPL